MSLTSGWAVGHALLNASDAEPNVDGIRVIGASLLRAKARADGFAMTAVDAASMTGELLQMLGGPAGRGPLGPHLALLSASIAAAGGAGTLAELVTRAIAHAAPAGGWPEDGSMLCGPNVGAAVALLHAAAEEGLHRPRAHAYEITEAMQECLEDVLWVMVRTSEYWDKQIAGHVIDTNSFPRFLTLLASYDMAKKYLPGP